LTGLSRRCAGQGSPPPVSTQPTRLIRVRNDAEVDVIEMFLRDFTIIDLTRRVSREAVDIRRSRKIPLPAAMIGASGRGIRPSRHPQCEGIFRHPIRGARAVLKRPPVSARPVNLMCRPPSVDS